MSVKPHLTSGASVHPEIDVTYSTGNEGQTICGIFSETTPLQRSSHSLRSTASVQCEGAHSLGIGFSRLKRLTIGQRLPAIRVNVTQRPYLSLSAALVSVPCLAVFRIRPVTRNSCLAMFCIPPLHVHFISACNIVSLALRGQVLHRGFAL